MIQQKLDYLLKSSPRTLLGVGPMSLTCVEATIELSDEYSAPLMLIASRRQIDCAEFGGGYVNSWSTENFSDFVHTKNKRGNIILARDHGGPWQNSLEYEQRLPVDQAMECAKKSYKVDIENGFQIIHIDPSLDPFETPHVDLVLERIYELYEYCWSYSQSLQREILFEIGTEEQNGSLNSLEEVKYALNSVEKFCKKNKIPSPTFIVLQTGTKTIETKNIGKFDQLLPGSHLNYAETHVPEMLKLCEQYGVYLKQHNTDYLSDEALKMHPRLGIHSANVAPEFGVVETKALISILEECRLKTEADQILQISYDSKKWEKWMLKDTQASDRDKAIISGHYIFSNPQFLEIKSKASHILNQKFNVQLDVFLKQKVKSSIFRYMEHFNLLNIN